MLVEGPYGRMTAAVRTQDRLTFIAAGIGITPMRALLEELDYRPGEATLIHRTSGSPDALLAHEITELARRCGVQVQHLPGARDPHGGWLPVGLSASRTTLHDLAPDIASSDVFLCGPEEWMRSVRDAARAAGVPDRQIHREHFAY